MSRISWKYKSFVRISHLYSFKTSSSRKTLNRNSIQHCWNEKENYSVKARMNNPPSVVNNLLTRLRRLARLTLMPWHWVSLVKEKLSTKEQSNIRERLRLLSCKKLIRHSYWELFLLIKAAVGKEYKWDSLEGGNSPTTINPSRFRSTRKVEGHCLFCYNSQESWTLGFLHPVLGRAAPTARPVGAFLSERLACTYCLQHLWD